MIEIDPTGEWVIVTDIDEPTELVLVHKPCFEGAQTADGTHAFAFDYLDYEAGIGACYNCRADVSLELIKKAIFAGVVHQ